MKIRAKVCSTLIALFILSLLLMGLATHQSVVKGTLNLQRHFVTDTATLTRSLIHSRVQWLYDYVQDMSYWDETYDLMISDRETAQSYFDEDLPDTSLGMDAILFFHEDGTLFHSLMLDEDGSDSPFLEELRNVLRESISRGSGNDRHGLLNLPSGPAMIATSQILTTDREGPSRGTLVLAQRFGREEGTETGNLAGIPLEIRPLTEARLDPSLRPVIDRLGPGQPPRIVGKSTDSRGYTLIGDMKGEPALLLSMPFPEELLTRQHKSLLLWALGMGSAFLLLLSATFLLLQKLVLRRLVKMTGSLGRLALSPDSDERLSVEGDDEIADVSHHFNLLMDSVKEARERLLQSEFRYRTIFERSPISLWEEDFSAIRKHLDTLRARGIEDLPLHLKEHPETVREISSLPRVLDINRMTLEILGAKTKEELMENLPSVFRDEGLHLLTDEILAIERGDDSFEGEGIHYTLDGRRLHVHVRWTSVPERNSFERVLLSVEDITERKVLEHRLRVLSLNDPLTGVNNRTFFDEQTHRLDSGRFDPLGLVYLDLDGLKLANDLLGHKAGDDILKRTGALLRKVFRESDIIARLGGDEFAVLLPQCDFAGLERAYERFNRELARHNESRPGSMPLHLSVGWDWREKGARPIAEMLLNADRRMYRRKRQKHAEGLLEEIRAYIEEQLRKEKALSVKTTTAGDNEKV